MKPDSLKCAYCPDPLGIDTPQPVFGWEFASAGRNEKQSAYRILVASSVKNLEKDTGDIWDSGKIFSDVQTGIGYTGRPLNIKSKYWWKVMAWEEKDRPAAWSAAAWFVTGFFQRADWNGQWLTTNCRVRISRKEFTIDPHKSIDLAIAYVACQGEKCNSFQLRINGRKVGNDSFSPGPAEDFRALYRSYDVTGMLRQGANALGLLQIKTSSVVLCVRYSDGSLQEVTTDETWRTRANGPFVYIGYAGAHLGKAEEYDARLEEEGWDRPGFNDAAWDAIKIPDWHSTPLFLGAQLVGCGIHQTRQAISVTAVKDNKFIADFGQNQSGFIRIKATGAPGMAITIRYAEKLDPAGAIDQKTYGTWEPPDHYCRYILRGDAEETYAPTFMHTGFRYVEITGYPGELLPENIESCFLHSDIENGSGFECSDPLLNKLQKCAVNGFLSNLMNVPTDCPGRERRGWTADAFAISQAECLNFNMLNIYYKWFADFRDCQRSFGWIPVELPAPSDLNIDVNWPTASILIPWDIFWAYGDRVFLCRFYDVMKNYFRFLVSISDHDYTIHERHLSYGDWLAKAKATKTYLGTVYFYRCAFLMSGIAAEIGKTAEAAEYEALACKIKESINGKFLKNDSGNIYYDNNSQSANAHALFFDLVPPADKPHVTASLVAALKTEGANTTGFLGTMCLLAALADNGRNDIAFSMVSDPTPGNWIHLVAGLGATTFPENFAGQGSQNHAFLGGSLSAWFYRYLAGMQPLRPGYKKFQIKPYIPSTLRYARARIHTPFGIVKAGWEKSGDTGIKISVTVPPNTTAVVYVPADDGKTVTENGRTAGQSVGIKHLGFKDGYALFEVGSGEYCFCT